MFNFVKIIPVEDTYFFKDDVPPNIKLSYNVIKLNYIDRSPFKTGDIIYLQKDKKLYIWFVKYPLEENRVYIPESYLIVKQTDINSGFIIYKKENAFNILVVKDKNLVSQISYKKEPPQLQLKLKLLAKEYSIKNPEIKELTSFTPKYEIRDIIKFSRFELSKENILKTVLQNTAVPLSLFFITLSVYKIADYRYLEYKKEKLEEYLFNLKIENKPVKKKIQIAKEKKEFWENFFSRELRYPFAYIVLSKVAKIIQSYEGFIDSITYSPEVISMNIGLPKKRGNFVKDLLKTGLFKDVKILGTVPDRLSKDFENLEVELYVKEWYGNGKK